MMLGASWERWSEGVADGRLDDQLEAFYGKAEVGAWRARYREALSLFGARYGTTGEEVVIARCPGQMNIMGVHIDYGGMPSIRLAVRGRDTLTVARANPDGAVRLSNVLRYEGEPEERFAPVSFDLTAVLPAENVGTRQALMDYAGRVCAERQARTGRAQVDDWSVLVQGQLVFLESLHRGRTRFHGFDGLVWSNVSPSGGMSSSSALVISTACAALGVHGLDPRRDLELADLVDGVGTSEWIRGTRGGTADHGGMILGHTGRLVSVGVFPAQALGYADLPETHAALILDSGVPRVYDEAMKEETVIAYPLGTFFISQLVLPRLAGTPGFEGLVPDYAENTHYIRDLTCARLGIGLPQLYQLLQALPQTTTLAEVEAQAGPAYAAFHQQQIGGRFQRIGPEYPIRLRRR
ncbi:MAG: galactokinase family protein, partial [Candidatus Latescibacterota bacterium]